MNYSEHDLNITDAVEAIRRQPELYTGSAEPTADMLIGRLACDILEVGDRTVSIGRIGEWWIVASDTDWIDANAPEALRCYFSSIIPFPEVGQNTFHCEVLISAFASDVIVFTPQEEIDLQGESWPGLAKVRRQHPEWTRGVAFRMGRGVGEATTEGAGPKTGE